jgi:hypothetical protein
MTAGKQAKPIRVIVAINPGIATPAQKAAWRRFWTKLVTGVRSDSGERSV